MMLKYKTMKRIFSIFMIFLLMTTTFYNHSSVRALEEDVDDTTQEVVTDPNEAVGENDDSEKDDDHVDSEKSPALFYPKQQPVSISNTLLSGTDLAPGETAFSKTAESIPGYVNTWKVTVEMWARDTQKTSDIVLVVDRSTSMSGTKLASAKTAAKNFVNTLLSGTYPNTRIALVSFGTAPSVHLGGAFHSPSAANRTALNDAIDGISISGTQYTHTQSAIRQAQILLASSTAEIKNIVLLSDGEPTRSYALNDTSQGSGNFPSSGNQRYNFDNLPASRYDYATTVGSGGNLTTQIGGSNRYYHHGNSAVGQATMAKASNYIIYTVALETNATGNNILGRIASTGKAYTGSSGDLNAIFQDIAGSISSSMTNISVLDHMGPGFEIPAHRVSSITTSQGTATYNSVARSIQWNLGSALNTVSGDATLRYGKLEYIVEINDDILSAPKYSTEVGGSTSPTGKFYNTNGSTVANYTNANGQPASHAYVSPRVNPVFYHVEKELQSATGTVLTVNRDFNVLITGTDYNRNHILNPSSSGNTGLVTTLRRAGQYSFAETGDLSAYDVTYYVDGVLVTDKVFNIVNDDTDDVYIKVVNKEKALGKLTIEKKFINTPPVLGRGPNFGISSILSFTFKITGPNGYENEVSLDPGESVTIENLVYGLYKVEELNTDGFYVTYEPVNGEVTLSFDNREQKVTVTNRPLTNISITARKNWQGNGPTPYPEVWFRLFRAIDGQDPVAVGVADKHVVSNSNNSVTVTWNDLPEFDSSGRTYTYSVRELVRIGDEVDNYEWIFGAPANYSVSENGLVITNTYQEPPTPENLTYVVVNKEWDLGETFVGTPPSAVFELFDFDDPSTTIATATVTYPDTIHVFNQLPATKKVDGVDVKINYQVRELPIAGFTSSPIVKTESVFSGVNRVTPNNSLDWNLGYNPSFVITKPTGNQPYIIWTLNVIPAADRAAFITAVKAAATTFGAILGPFGSLSITDSIVWISGPSVSYDIYPSDPSSGLIEVNISFNPDGTIDDESTIVFENQNTWTQFIVGAHSPVEFDVTNTYAPTGSFVPAINKVLTGRPLQAGEFTFELFEGATKIGQATNTAAGLVTFTEIEYDLSDVGTKHYTVKEVAGVLGGVQYSNQEIYITVVITDNGDGTLGVVATYDPLNKTITNTYTASGKAQIAINKVLTGRALKAGEFTFELFEGATKIGETTNTAAGLVTFAEITYGLSDVGTKNYTVKEVVGSLGGVQYSDQEIGVIVTITDNGNGTLNVVVNYNPHNKTITNTYTASGKAQIAINKVLTGRALQAGEFTFELFEGLTKIGETTNTAAGLVNFSEITYGLSDVGTKHYTVKEVVGSLGGVQYSAQEIDVTVVISDKGDGTLNVVVTYDPLNKTITNTYTASGKAQIAINKVLTGRALKAGEFTFELFEGLTKISETTNTAAGVVTFADITYGLSDVGTKHYTVKEVVGALGGVQYSAQEIDVTVVISDKGDGTLNVVVTYDPLNKTITNTYTASGSWLPALTKKLIAGGRILKANEFKFNLYLVEEDSDTLLQANVGNNAGGGIPFTALNYTQADAGKTYFYKVVEVAGSETGMIYDPLEIEISVAIIDLGNGVLSVTPSYPNVVEFTNRYLARGSWTPEVLKVLNAGGRSLVAGEFSFQLLDDEDSVLQTKTNSVTGAVLFDPVMFDETAIGQTFTYKIVEVVGSETGMTYDPLEVLISVTVSDLGNGLLEVNVSYPEDVEFNNQYQAQGSHVLEITKLLEGRDLNASEFEFTLALGDVVLETITNAADGLVSFSALSFTQADIGKTFVYTIKEVVGSLGGVSYDETEITVELTVTDGGNGTLLFETDYSLEELTNEYFAQPVNVSFQGHKILEGRNLKAGEFEFVLYHSDSEGSVIGLPIQTVTNGADGTVLFDPLTYEFGEAGTYYYVIVETVGTLGGVLYDTNYILIKVVVVDNLEGEMEASILYMDELQTFTNLYEATPVDVTIEGLKSLIGRPLQDDEFEFELLDHNDVVVGQAFNRDGKLVFNLVFDEIGIYDFTLREVAGSLPFITYDDQVFEITVYVTDNLEGQLLARVEHDELVFENTYITNPRIEIEKRARLVSGKEAFMLSGEVIEYVITATNTGDIALINVEIEDSMVGLYNVRFDIIHVGGSRTANVVNGLVTLQPGEKLEMTALYATTVEDVQALIVINIANVKGYEPDPFDPEKPVDPETPVVPDGPVRAEVPGEEPDPLPETGFNVMNPLISLAMTSAGLYLLLKKRKKDDED